MATAAWQTPSTPMQTLSSKVRPFLSLFSPSCLTYPFRRRRSLAFSARALPVDKALMKENWLDSLSLPSPEDESTRESSCVIGIDPDLSGALALIGSSSSAQVYDSPHLPVLVGKRIRKRLNVKSMVQLIQSLHLPSGTRAYIEQSNPFPKDGKQGWHSGGFGYGLWIGALVASGFSVIPVSSSLWKRHFQLAGGSYTKDDSRRVASELFPLLSDQLKRKKDHGRAEALLIAAFGESLKPVKLPQELLVSSHCLENQSLKNSSLESDT